MSGLIHLIKLLVSIIAFLIISCSGNFLNGITNNNNLNDNNNFIHEQYDSTEYLVNLSNTNQLYPNNSEYVNRNGYVIYNNEILFERHDANFQETNNQNESNMYNKIINNQSAFCNDTLFKCISLSILLCLLIICTIIGNSFVIAAVILERNLHNLGNYLIVSLAFSDLTVAVMVMPIGAYQEVSRTWSLGKIVCDIWTSFDVLSCTASILHLVAIALDRYMAITNLDYGAKRTPKRIITTISIIWTVSAITAVSPHIFGLSFDEASNERCQLTDNFTYQLFSTLAAFYLPLIIMCIIYWKIFQAAKFRIRKKGFVGNNGTEHHHQSKKANADKNKKKNENNNVSDNVNSGSCKKENETTALLNTKNNSNSLKNNGNNKDQSKKNIIQLDNMNNNIIIDDKNSPNKDEIQEQRNQIPSENINKEEIERRRTSITSKKQLSKDQESLWESDDSSIISIRNELIRNKEKKEQMRQQQLELQNSANASKIKKIIFKNKFLFKNLYSLQMKHSNTNNSFSNHNSPRKKSNEDNDDVLGDNNKHAIKKSISLKEEHLIETDLIAKNNIKKFKSAQPVADQILDNSNENNNQISNEKKLRFKLEDFNLNKDEYKIDNEANCESPSQNFVYTNFSPRPQKIIYLFDDTSDTNILNNYNNDNNNNIQSPIDLETSIIMYKDLSFYDRLSLNTRIPFAFPESDILSNSNISVENSNFTNTDNKKENLEKQNIPTVEILNNDANKKIIQKEVSVKVNSDNLNQTTSVKFQTHSENKEKNEPKPLDNKQIPNELTKQNLKVVLDNKNRNNSVVSTVQRSSDVNSVLKKRAKIDIKRERKAAKTLGVIMSCFIICWLPFFLMQILFSVCKDCKITEILEKSPLITILTWSGYLNSLLNPIIYTIFSPDFRSAFAKILFGRYNRNNARRKSYLK